MEKTFMREQRKIWQVMLTCKKSFRVKKKNRVGEKIKNELVISVNLSIF